jgi:hypothetical protein
MPLKINGATSGSVTLAAPATGSDVTLTLPGSAGTVAVLGGNTYTGTHNFNAATVVDPPGRIIQVVTGTSTTTTAVTSTTMTDSTLTATITPSSATNKILVIVNQSIQLSNSSSMGGAIRVMRGSTVISSDDTYQTIYNSGFAGAFTIAARAGFSILDSPSTTSATTYKTQIRREAGSGTVTAQYGSSQSQIILMEVTA